MDTSGAEILGAKRIRRTRSDDEEQCVFLSVEIERDAPPELMVPAEPNAHPIVADPASQSRALSSGHVEIGTPSGFRVTAEGTFDRDALGRLLKALAS